MKHSLTHAKMVERKEFCKHNIKDDKTTFQDMMDVIHVDEKWFNIKKNPEDTIWRKRVYNIRQCVAKDIASSCCRLS